MVATLLAALILCVVAPAPAQEADPENPPRFLQLPDVTLSAEDPLFLKPPSQSIWSEELVGQPAIDKLGLSPVETPFPAPEPPGLLVGLSLAGLHPADAPRVAAPIGRPPLWSPSPSDQPTRDSAAWEYGFEFRHVFAQSTLAGLRFDGDLGSWVVSGDGECSITNESPSSAILRLQATPSAEPWHNDLHTEAAAVFSSEALLAGGLAVGAGAALDGERFRFASQTEVRIEGWQVDAADAGWIWQELEASSTGAGIGMYGAAAASLLSAQGASGFGLDGLARLGFSWKGARPLLRLRAGAALRYYGGELDVVPEAGIEVRPAPALRIQAWLGPFLEEPLPLHVRALYDPSNTLGLHAQGGMAVRGALLLDWPRICGAQIMAQALDGFQYRLREGTLRWERARELELDATSSWTLLRGSERRTGVGLQLSAFAALPLPIPERAMASLLRRGLDGGIEFSLPKPALDLTVRAHWGDFPLQDEQALLAGSRNPFSGWMASVLVRGGRGEKLAWYGGVEASQPDRVKAVLGWSTQGRIGR